VATIGTIHAIVSVRADSRMTAASIPKGSEKNIVESSRASANTPTGDANVARIQDVTARIGLRSVHAAGQRVRDCAQAAPNPRAAAC